MDNLQLVKDLLETRLDALDEKIDTHNNHTVKLLNLIKVETSKTNGRVNKLEENLTKIKLEQKDHVINCPRLKDITLLNDRINRIEDENFIIKVWNRYPKQLLTVVIVTVALAIGSIGYTLLQVHSTMGKIKQLNASSQETPL